MAWQNLKAGAGGDINALDMHADGTVVCRTDVFGGYYYNRSASNPGNAGGIGAWQQLVTTTSLAAFPSIINRSLYCNDGLHEIRIAPTNSNIFYMVYLGFVWISTNRGVTWTQTAYTQNTALVANQGQQRNYRYKMAIDNNTADVVYFADYINGPSFTINGTGAGTWTAISGLNAVDANQTCCVAIDPQSSLTSGRRSIVYISVSGTGLYKSTTGGGSGTYSLVTSTPTQIIDLWVNANGVVFCVDGGTSKLWRLAGSTWTDITPSGVSANSIALDLNSAKHVIVCSFGGTPRETADAETATPTWTPATAPHVPVTYIANDVPMPSTLFQNPTFWSNVISPVIDGSNSNIMWVSASQSIYTTPLPLVAGPTATFFTSVCAGIEEIVANNICVPPGAAPLLVGWDIGLLRQPNVNTYLPHQNWDTRVFLSFGSWADYATTDSTFVAGVFCLGGAPAKSTDSGETWTQFSGTPSGGLFAGSIACASPTEMIWVQSQNGQPQYTNDGGATWGTIASLPSDGWNFSYFYNRCDVAADRVTARTFYIQNGGGSSNAQGTYVITNGALANYFPNKISSTVYDSTSVGSINNGAGYSKLSTVPNNAGHLFFCSGPMGSGGTQGNPASAWPHSALFWYSHNGGSTWADVSGLSSNNWTIREVWSFGFGKNAPGQTYPAIYIYGFVAVGASPLPAGSVPGLWASYDNCVTWTQISGQYPVGWLDWVKTVNGDMNIYGRIYVGSNGSGWVFFDLGTTPAYGFSVITDSGQRRTKMINISAVSSGSNQSASSSMLLLESGSFLLLEDGTSRLRLE